MLDFPLVPQVKLPFVERINPQSKYSAINGVEKEVTGDSKSNHQMTVLRIWLLAGTFFS